MFVKTNIIKTKLGKRYENHSVLSTIVTSIAFMIFVLLLLFNIVNRYSSQWVENQVVRSNERQIQLISNSIDEQVHYVNKLLYRYISDYAVTDLTNLINSNYSMAIQKRRLHDIIRQDIYMSNILYDIQVIYKNQNIIVNKNGVYNTRIYNYLYTFDDNALYKFSDFGEIKIRKTTLNSIDQSVNLLCFIYTGKDYSIGILLDKDMFMKTVKNINIGGNNDVLIYGSSGIELLENSQNPHIPDIMNDYTTRSAHGINILIQESKYIKSYKKSIQTGWEYLVLTPYKDILLELSSLNYVYMISYVVIMILGVIYALYYKKMIYHPVKELVNNISSDNQNHVKNEFVALRRFIDVSRNENETIKSFLRKNHLLIRKKLLENMLLTGDKIKDSELRDYYKDFIYSKYLLIKFVVANHNNIASLKNIEEIMAAFKDKMVKYEILTLNPKVFLVVVNYSMILDNFLDVVNKKNKILNAEETNIICCVSTVVNDINQLILAYEQVNRIYYYRTTKCNRNIFLLDDIAIEQKYLPEIIKNEKNVYNSIINGDMVGLEKLLGKLALEDMHISVKELDEILQLLHYIVKRILVQRNVDLKDILSTQNIETYNSFNEMLDTERKIKLTTRLVYSAAEYMYNLKAGEEDVIIQYIKSNYYNYITLDLVAQKFNMNANYLSTYIKRKVGLTFTEYMNNLRISAAKNYIANSEKTLQEISESLGFESASSFIRFFRKMEGCTPGQYKKSNTCENIN